VICPASLSPGPADDLIDPASLPPGPADDMTTFSGLSLGAGSRPPRIAAAERAGRILPENYRFQSVSLFITIEDRKERTTVNNAQTQTVIPGGGPGAEYVGKIGIWIILTAFCLLALGLLSALFVLWPDSDLTTALKPVAAVSMEKPSTGTPSAQTSASKPTNSAGNPANPEGNKPSVVKIPQQRVLLLVALAGALGGSLYSLISLSWYVGNRELKWSWVPSYLVRPFTAAALAGIFFLILATGVWTGVTGTGQLWIIGFAALVGLFSKEGYQRLKMIFEALFAPAPKGADSVKTTPAGTLVIDKSSGQQGDIVQITGSGFTAATTVRFDAVAAAVIVKSPTVLSVTVPPHSPGQVDITVTNPGNPPEIHTLKFTYT
jgi:hypothetical protein